MEILTASDASKSEVTGLDLTQVSQGNTINITVTAKDSSGNSIASGGEKFIVKISNACTKYNQYYCAPSGSTKPLSSNINDVMTDHNNGTYTYSYPVPNTLGSISVQIYLLTQGKVYHEYYNFKSNFSETPINKCTVNGLKFSDSDLTNFCGTSVENFSTRIMTSLLAPYTGSIKFNIENVDGINLYINDAKYNSNFCIIGIFTKSYTIDLVKDKYYTFYTEYCQGPTIFRFILSWSYNGQSQIEIPSSNLFLPSLVGFSPYNIQIVESVCGDAFKTGTEECDDGNTVDGDGCSSKCAIETNLQRSGEDSMCKDKCSENIDQAKSTMGQAIAGVSGSIATLFSLCNVSAPTGLWITMNQFQLIMLLLLTKSNIPKSIVSYLSGLKATTCSFNFIPFKEIPGFDKIVNGLDFRLPDVELKYFGINSGSTFANNFSLICILFIFIAIHSLFLLIHRLLKSKVKSKKICVKFLEKTFQFFAFSLYIRVMLEANVFLLLSSFSELYHWDTSSLSKIISICFAFTCGWICFTIISLSLVNYSIHKDTQNIDNYIPFKEFLTGVKETRMSRLYPTILLLRRFLFIGLLIFGQSLNSFELICPMIIIQLAYLVNLAIVRPYKKVRDNVIEVTNECFYLVLISLLSHFNSKDRWISAIENIYFGIILSNSMSIIFILIAAFSVSCIVKLKQCCKKKRILPKERQKEVDKFSDLRICKFSSFKVSNVDHQHQALKEPQSNIAFNEESKDASTNNLKPSRTPTPAELYWQRYNSIDGGKQKD